MKGCLLAMFLLGLCGCRIYDQTFTFSAFRKENGWIYLNKMVFAPGNSTISFQTTAKGSLTAPIELEFAVISDEVWDAEKNYKCDNTQYKPTISLLHSLNPNNEPSTTSLTLSTEKEHLYYMVLRDCKKGIVGNRSLASIVVSTKLVILNSDSHLGSEEDSWLIYPLVLLVGAWLVYRIDKQKPWEGEKNWIQIILFLGIIARTSALFWKSLGYLIYWRYGSNYTIFEIFYLALHGLSECIMICIIILVAFGWYILFLNHQDFDIFISLLALLGTMNIVLNVLNVINDDSHDKYHMYDTIPTLIQTAFRLIALFCLFCGIKINWKKLTPDRRIFILKFAFYGTLYILSLPLMVMVSRLVEKTKRQEFVFIWSQVFQLISSGLITYMTTYKYSSYNKINITNTTFLPEQQNQKFF